MTPTDRDAEPATGVAADASTLRALEFGAIVEQLAALTAFAPSRELAEASAPLVDGVHLGLLHDQTDEAARLLLEQSQATIGGVRDVRQPLERARRGGRLAPAGLLEIAETLRATTGFAARLTEWRGTHLASVRD